MSDGEFALEPFCAVPIKPGQQRMMDTPVLMDVVGDRPAVVDFRDAGLLSTLKWRFDGNYVTTNSYYSMHRLIMRNPKGKVVHHKNEDTFDNRRSNLAVVKRSVHTRYHKVKRGKLGVHKTKGGSYMATEQRMNVGFYDTEEEAALAYDWAARILLGPQAEVNFPDVIVAAMAAFMIRQSGGEYFDVGFKKRTTGEYRFLTCRTVNPPGPFYMAGYNLILVKAKNLEGYRAIPIEGIEALYINDKKYRVVP